MASYSANIIDDGSGNYTATLFRAPTTAASGGTALTGTGDYDFTVATKLGPGYVLQRAIGRISDDRSING